MVLQLYPVEERARERALQLANLVSLQKSPTLAWLRRDIEMGETPYTGFELEDLDKALEIGFLIDHRGLVYVGTYT